jgi:hypothetical protein
MPIALTDAELDIVFAAARPLELAARDSFLKAIADRLATIPERGDGIVHRIAAEVQRDFWDPPVGPDGKWD